MSKATGKHPQPVCCDFETYSIERRPAYPPKPVGVSIKPWGKKPVYFAWGHPTKNNCTFEQAKKALSKAWACPDGVLFQNGKFDVDVAETHMGIKSYPWAHYHDTYFLLFLDDPHQNELSLKPSAERLLGMKPEEQDAVCEWLLKNQPVPGVKISRSKQSDHYFGKYIAYAPGDLVGKYANGDTTRTERLFKLLWSKTKKRKMLDAYDEERELMLNLLETERQGIPVDLKRLERDAHIYGTWRDRIEVWIRHVLKADADLNLSSGPQLVEALIKVKKVDIRKLGVTPTGKYQTNKEALQGAVTDPALLNMLKYRAQLNTCLNTFLTPWLIMARASKGRIFTTWNQCRNDEFGARTGRLSSSPNFQNIPNAFQALFKHQDKKAKLPKCPFPDLPMLPLMGDYIIPFPGEVLLKRDYSQQELRVLAHFEDAGLKDGYLADPWLDLHEHAKVLIKELTGLDFPRKDIKTLGFGLIYGMGVGLLAERMGVTYDEAKLAKDAYLTTFPALKQMYADMKRRMQAKLPIRTWGGREYYCEPAKTINDRLVQFDYKLVNVLVQGSSADCTKEAINTYCRLKPKTDKLLINVHDELLVSVPKSRAKPAMDLLRRCMESVTFDVPMLSEGYYSLKSWHQLKDFDKKGKVVLRGTL